MAEPWRASNELERRICAAVETGDLEAYLKMLRGATVVAPTSDPSPAAGWLVKTVDGLPHIAVFTSREAKQTDPAARSMAEVELTLPELAGRWPDPHRRLAVNPGLPIGIYLPAEYLLRNAIPPAEAEPSADTAEAEPLTVLQLPRPDPDRSPAEPTNRAEHELAEAIAARDPERALRAVLDATLFLISTERDGYTAPGEPGFQWLALQSRRGEVVPLFTTRDRVYAGLGASTYSTFPVRLLDLVAAWPSRELGLVVNPRTSLTLRLPGPGVLGLARLAGQLGIRREVKGFRPTAAPDPAAFDAAAGALRLDCAPGVPVDVPSPQEEPLQAAVAAGDVGAYLRALLGMSLRLPFPPDGDPGVRYAGHRVPWQPVEVGGRTALAAFTSSAVQRLATGGAARSSAETASLLRHWPDPDWDLVVNPGTGMSARLPGEDIASLSAWCDQWLAHQRGEKFPAGERIDLQLIDAARRGDRNAFLELLRPARVMVGTPEKGQFFRVAVTDPGFPWHPVPVRGRDSILVYTSNEWRRHTGGSGSTALARFGELAAAWPAGGPDLVLNPATPVSITLSADQVREFATA